MKKSMFFSLLSGATIIHCALSQPIIQIGNQEAVSVLSKMYANLHNKYDNKTNSHQSGQFSSAQKFGMAESFFGQEKNFDDQKNGSEQHDGSSEQNADNFTYTDDHSYQDGSGSDQNTFHVIAKAIMQENEDEEVDKSVKSEQYSMDNSIDSQNTSNNESVESLSSDLKISSPELESSTMQTEIASEFSNIESLQEIAGSPLPNTSKIFELSNVQSNSTNLQNELDGINFLNYGLITAGTLATAFGAYHAMKRLYKQDDYLAQETKSKRKIANVRDKIVVTNNDPAAEILTAFLLFGISQYSSWNDIEIRYKQLQEGIRQAHLDVHVLGPIAYTNEQVQMLQAYDEAYNTLKKYYKVNMLPYTIKQHLAEKTVQNANDYRKRREQAIYQFDQQQKKSIKIPVSLQKQENIKNQMLGLVAELEGLKRLASNII